MGKNLLVVLSLFLFQCGIDDQVELISFKTEGCDGDSFELYEFHPKNRIKRAYFKKNELVLDIFFVESCGYMVDPSISYESNVLLIDTDKNRLDSTRVYALCLCCYDIQLIISGLEDANVDCIEYRLFLDTEFPERIYITDSVYHTYNIDYAVIEGDTIAYPKQTERYLKRIFSENIENGSSYIFSYFPDGSDIFCRKTYSDGSELLIQNGSFERRDSLNMLIEHGTVKYDSLKDGEGVRVMIDE